MNATMNGAEHLPEIDAAIVSANATIADALDTIDDLTAEHDDAQELLALTLENRRRLNALKQRITERNVKVSA